MDDDPLRRIEALEERVEALEQLLHDRAAPPRATWVAPHLAPPPWPAPGLASAPPTAPAARRAAPTIDSETLLKWGGVGLVVLAIGFAVSTAISRGWIGPELQLVGAVAVSLGLVAAGVRLRPSRPRWTHALCSGGMLGLVTTWASDLFLDQADDRVAFAATIATGAAGLALARRLASEWVGAATLLGAVIGWFVIGGDEPPVVASTVWVTALAGASIAIAVQPQWHAMRFVAHLVAMPALVGLAAEASGAPEPIAVLAGAALVCGSLVRVPSLGELTSAWQQLEIQLVIAGAPFGFWVVALATGMERDSAIGATAIAAAGTALAIALAVRATIHRAHFVSQLIGASVALSIGLAVLLSTTAAFTSLAVQGAGLVVLGRALGGNVRVLVNAAILLVVVVVYDLAEMLAAWTDDAPVPDDLAHAVIVAALAVAIWQTHEQLVWRLGAPAVLVLTLIWTGSVLVHLPQGQAAVSVSWALIGTALLVAGALRKMPEVGGVGLAVLALTVGKLLTVDLQEVDTLWRAGLFFVVGLGFLRLGFLLPRLMGASDEETAEPPPE